MEKGKLRKKARPERCEEGKTELTWKTRVTTGVSGWKSGKGRRNLN